jgi:amino acid adenylation domain-containing protein
MLAAFQLLLSRYTGQKDIVVGTPIANRNRAETEGLIGFFVNTLVLRTDVSGDPTFRQLLARVRDVAYGAYAHQDLPFEKIVQELNPERSQSYAPLFQVSFAMQSQLPKEQQYEMHGLTLSTIAAQSGTSKFDLVQKIVETKEGLLSYLHYSTDLFEEATIRRMASHFLRLLEAAAASPDLPVSRLPLLDSAERQRLLSASNLGAPKLPASCVHRLFEEQAARTPHATAVTFEDLTLTYRELDERSNQLAHHLQSLGVGPESLVGVLLERSAEMVVSLLAVLKAGGAYVPLDPSYPLERLRFMLKDSRAGVLITRESVLTQDSVAGIISGIATEVVFVEADSERISLYEGSAPPSAVTPENLAYVIYTSGSTGRPKGSLVTHRNVSRLLAAAQPHFKFGPSDVWTMFHSYAFDFSVWEVWGALATGGSVVVVPYWVSRSPDEFRRLLSERGVTVLNQTPAAFRQLSASVLSGGGEAGLSLRYVIFGGEALDPSTLSGWLARFGDSRPRLVNMYGITETTIHVTLRPLTCSDGCGHASPIGPPLDDLELYVLDSRMGPVPEGVAGELYVGGDGLARGYIGRAALTAERFVPHPFSAGGGERLYRTGDVARRGGDGELYYVGRCDEQVKVRGFRIELGEIEAALQSQECVRECVVVARETEGGDKRLVAYVVGEAAWGEVSVVELRGHLKGRLPEYMVPSAFVTMEAMPLTANGKVDRRALPEPSEAGVESSADYAEASTPVQEVLAGIWSQVLGVERVGVNDNFFELGGHSLLATQLVSRIRESFSVDMPLRAVFESPTVAGLAAYVEQEMGAGSTSQAFGKRAPRSELLPLSFSQQRLWFLDRLNPGSSSYNLPSALRLNGPLDLSALQSALDELVRRHEALRTTFPSFEGVPVQHILPASSLPLRLSDFSSLEPAERERAVKAEMAEEAAMPFDLAGGPMLRAKVLRLGAEEHVVMLTMHHIVSDGWSMGILMREISTLYGAFSKGEASPLPELPVQYADYAVWQREWLQGEALEEQLSYWREHLSGAPPILELPTDRPRPAVQTYRGASHTFILPPELCERLKELGHRESVTPFMVLLAAFDVLLSRHSGQNDVSVGTPIAGRSHTEVEGLIGFFVNTLVLRTRLDGGESVRDLLRRVREVCLGAYQHQDLPFEKLVEELQPERDTSRTPLFQVMFVMQNTAARDGGGERDRNSSMTAREQGVSDSTAKFDLTLEAFQVGERIGCGLEYNTDLFDASTVERMAEHFVSLLGGIVGDPERKVGALPMLCERERTRLLYEYNATEADYPREVPIHRLFEEQAARTPHATAVTFEDLTLTYRELDERSNQLAHHLQSLGVGTESPVGILLEHSAEMVVALLGVLKAGGAYLPLDPIYPRERLRFMLEDAAVGVLITQESLAGVVPGVQAEVVIIDVDSRTISGRPVSVPASTVKPVDAAYVIYTSGSTGTPKGVVIEHRSLVNYIWWASRVYLRGDSLPFALYSSLAFDLTVTSVYTPLITGNRVAVYRAAGGESVLPRILRDGAAGVLKLTPAHLATLRGQDWRGSGVRRLIVGGEALDAGLARDTIESFGAGVEIYNEYGPTEATVGCMIHRFDPARDARASVPIGVPAANTRIYVLDGGLRPAAENVGGELYIGGDGLARGYLNRAGLTADRFVADPFCSGARMYRTGDIARWLPGGIIEYVGRRDEQVKVRGFRVELGEIEAALQTHEGVKECVVAARTWEGDDRRITAYLVAEGDAAPEPAALREYLKERLPDYMVPTFFISMGRLPLTANGKVDRDALPEPGYEGLGAASEFVEPRDRTELELANIWREVLALERVGVRDNFFELGGHSLLAVRVFALVEKRLGVRLPLTALFQGPTVEGLAEAVRGRAKALASASSSLVEVRGGGARPPFFCVHPAGGNVLCYSELARHLGGEQPFYAFQSKGLTDEGERQTSIEEMAEHYVGLLRGVQPEGPYRLGGWSLGGVVAFEMARQLERKGQRVSLLAVIDVYAPGERREGEGNDDLSLMISFARDLGLSPEKAGISWERAREMSRHELLRYVLDEAQQGGLVPSDVDFAGAQRLWDVFKANVRAFDQYRGGAYGGRVTLLSAAEGASGMSDDPSMGWAKFAAGGVLIEQVPGSHYTVVRPPHVGALAAGLSACLRESAEAAQSLTKR